MSVRSMTGFGRARGPLSERLAVSVVVRSVNHRYFDLQVKINLREEMPEVEAVVREVVNHRLERGRITAQLVFERSAIGGNRVVVDAVAVQSVLDQLRELADVAGTPSPVGLGDVLGVPGLVTVSGEETVLSDEEQNRLRDLVETATAGLTAMRLAEGERLARQIRSEVAALNDFLGWIEPQLPVVRLRLHERLRDRVNELLGSDLAVDPGRVAQEAALAADRADVGEEVVRLRSHLAQVAGRLDTGRAVGRTLDFLCQEVNRELNTLAAKCRELDVVDRLVEARAATERIREQVQNLE